AEAVFDELRRGRNMDDKGADYDLAARLLRGLGGQSVATFLRALRFPPDAGARDRLHRRLGADCVDDPRVVGPDGKVALVRARRADRHLAQDICTRLGVLPARLVT